MSNQTDQMVHEAWAKLKLAYALPYQAQENVLSIIKSAIEKARQIGYDEGWKSCHNFKKREHECRAARAIEQSESDFVDIKRLAEFVIRCGDHMISGSNIADTPLPTEQEWRNILDIADSAMKHEKN